MNRSFFNTIIPVLAIMVVFIAAPTEAQAKDAIYTSSFNNNAAGGFDVVAYFNQGAPIKGSAEFQMEHAGANWRFSTAENLAAFNADPTAYAPQYGGYCAWAVSQNYTARGNPKNWTIVDGKLYLNYSDKIQARWEKDIPGFIVLAEQNWPAVLN